MSRVHSPSDGEPSNEHTFSMRRAALLTALVGLLHAVLFLVSLALIATAPGAKATDTEIIAYYGSPSGRLPVIAGIYVMPFAAIAFMWFIVALRWWTTGSTRRESPLMATMQLTSGIVYVCLFCAGAAALAVLAVSVEFADGPIDPVVARQFPQYGNALIMIFAVRIAAIFVFVTSNTGRTSGILPRWFVVAGYGAGTFLLLGVSFVPVLVVVFPAWLFILSALLIVRAGRIPDSRRLRPPGGEPSSGRRAARPH